MCNKVTNSIFCMYRLGKQLNENSSLFVEIHIKSLQNATHPHMLRIGSLIANDSQTDTYRAPKMTRRSQRAYRQANWTLRHTLAVWSALENVVVSVKVSETESILVSKTRLLLYCGH